MRTMLAGLVLYVAAGLSASSSSPTLADCDAPTHARVLQAATAGPVPEARAIWLDARTLRWPGEAAVGRIRLYHSASSQLRAGIGSAVRGADEVVELSPATREPAPAVLARFRHVGAGVTLHVTGRETAQLGELQRGQLLLVREDASGHVLAATRLQSPGALDDLYASAGDAVLGATVAPGRSRHHRRAPAAGVRLRLGPRARLRDADAAGRARR